MFAAAATAVAAAPAFQSSPLPLAHNRFAAATAPCTCRVRRLSSLRGNNCSSMSAAAAQADVRVGRLPEHLLSTVRAEAARAIAAHGAFRVAISGGSLPKQLAAAAAAAAPSSDIFANWHVFLADERVVALDAADSNFREIVDRLPMLRDNTLAIDPALAPDDCARDYNRRMSDALAGAPLDAVLLGLGPDGHTCSLFPGHPLLDVTDRPVAGITNSPKPPPQRITLTLPELNRSAAAIFVVTGAAKAPAVKDILENEDSVLPGARVHPTDGKLVWLLDEAAGAELSASAMSNSDVAP